MKQALILISVLIFLCSSEFLQYSYPNVETDYNEFLKYYYLDDKINEVLLTILFLLTTLQARVKVVKALSIFGFVIAFASTIDKVVLNMFHYLYTDVLILIFATCLSYFVVYKKKSKNV